MLATTVVPINKSDNTSISQSDFTCIALFIQKEWSSHKSQIKSLEFALKNTNSLNDASSWFCPDFRCDCYNCLFLSFCVCVNSEEDLPVKPQKEWVHMNKLEPEKLEWMRDLPAPRRKGTKKVVRYYLQ